MDELQISGKRFISARRIARENGYTSDYIGQLIRGNKIKGQKVGRAWYVDAATFDTYLGQEHSSTVTMTQPEPVTESVAQVIVGKVAPEPIVETAETAEIAEEVMQEEEQELLPSVEEIEKITETPMVAVVEPAVEETKAVMDEPRRIPLHVFAKVEPFVESVASKSNLRYVVDDSPSLPEISRLKKESRMGEREVSEEKITHAAFDPIVKKSRSKVMVGTLAVLAVAIFAISAYVSSTLSLNLSISEGNSANASYSMHW